MEWPNLVAVTGRWRERWSAFLLYRSPPPTRARLIVRAVPRRGETMTATFVEHGDPVHTDTPAQIPAARRNDRPAAVGRATGCKYRFIDSIRTPHNLRIVTAINARNSSRTAEVAAAADSAGYQAATDMRGQKRAAADRRGEKRSSVHACTAESPIPIELHKALLFLIILPSIPSYPFSCKFGFRCAQCTLH